MSTLPEKPSELIRLALHDMELCEQDDRYIIDMDAWHVAFENKCYVCLAGSIIAKSLSADIFRSAVPRDYNTEIIAKLLAIEEFRLGYVYNGIRLLVLEQFMSKGPDYLFELFDSLNYKYVDRDIIKYEENPEKFTRQMHKLADDLERVGL